VMEVVLHLQAELVDLAACEKFARRRALQNRFQLVVEGELVARNPQRKDAVERIAEFLVLKIALTLRIAEQIDDHRAEGQREHEDARTEKPDPGVRPQLACGRWWRRRCRLVHGFASEVLR